ncbi:MAG: ferredoxin--NADP reductase [Cytophagales bacterium]|nr:ferredoxin--NADP reductase [Cytophagales bacterium]
MKENFIPVSVKDVKRETAESVSISFEVTNGLGELNYQPGQYVFMRMMIDEVEYLRPYSLSSAPYEDDFTVTVKRLRGGVVSNFINDRILKGDKIEILPPKGDFYPDFKPETTRQHFFFGAGSGITPLMSIMKSLLHREPDSKVYLLYGNRNEDGIMFKSELDHLQLKYPDRFFVEYLLSAPKRYRQPGLLGFIKRGDIRWDGKIGQIDNASLTEFFTTYPIQDRSKIKSFVCGPSGMMEASINYLTKIGFNSDDILSESFHRDHNDILPGGNIKNCKTTITYKGESYQLDIDDNRPILDSLLKKDVIIPFACRSGVCASCVCKVVKGKVNTRQTKGLKKEFHDLGYILSCQSIPTTDHLEIDYDSEFHNIKRFL